jgi:hypothetical protein
MSPNCFRWSTPSRQFVALAADRFASPRSSTPTVVTILTRIAAGFASAASNRLSPGVAQNTAAAAANFVGSSNVLILGSMVSVASALALNAALTFTKHS